MEKYNTIEKHVNPAGPAGGGGKTATAGRGENDKAADRVAGGFV